MMVLCFAAMTLALAALHRDRYGPAVAALVVCLGLCAGLFLFEVHDAAYGFRMPWLQG